MCIIGQLFFCIEAWYSLVTHGSIWIGSEEIDLAVSFLENLTKVPRFDILVMCITASDKEGNAFP